MRNKRSVVLLVCVLMLALMSVATVTAIGAADRSAEANTLRLYDWRITDENGGNARQTQDGIAISAPGYYRNALDATNASVSVDFSAFTNNGSDNNPQNIAYFVFAPTPKRASYDFTGNGDGLYIHMRSYETGLYVGVESVNGGAQKNVVPFAGTNSGLGMNKTELTGISLRTAGETRELVFSGTGNKEKAIDISAVPLASYAVPVEDGTPYCYFGTFTWGDNGITADDRTFTVKSVAGALKDETLTDKTGRLFAESDYVPQTQDGKTDANEWMVNSGNVTDYADGVKASGNSVLYAYAMSAEKITVFTDFSDLPQTAYDKNPENLVYFGFTKEATSSAGYTLPSEGLYLVFRNYGGFIHLQLHRSKTLLLSGSSPNSATGMRATELQTVSLVRLEEQGFALYLNNVRINVPELAQVAHTEVADANGRAVFSICTYSNAGALTVPMKNVQGSDKKELESADWKTGAAIPETPDETTTAQDFIEIKDNGLDKVTETEKGLSVTGGGFYSYALSARSDIELFVSLPALAESVLNEAGDNWTQQGLAYLCITKSPTNAHFTYPVPGLYFMFRNMGGYLTLTVSCKTDGGATESIMGSVATRMKVEDLSYIALRKRDGEGYDLQLNDKISKSSALSSLTEEAFADAEGKTYFGVFTWSDKNENPEEERTVLLTAVKNEGKTAFAPSDYYYYDSGETVTAPETVLNDSELSFVRASAFDEKTTGDYGIRVAGGGYLNYKYRMSEAGDRIRVFAQLSALKESTYNSNGQYAAQGLAYFCFTKAPTHAHYTYPEQGIYVMFRNEGGTVHLDVQYKYFNVDKDELVTQTVISGHSAIGDTGLALKDITSFTLDKTQNGYTFMLNDKNIRVNFGAIPDGIISDEDGNTYVGVYTWATPDKNPYLERSVTLRQIVSAHKEAFTPTLPQYYVKDGELMQAPEEKASLDDFVFRADMFLDTAEQTDDGVLCSKPGYYNYALDPDDVTVFVSLPSFQATTADYTKQSLLYLYFGSTPVEASWDYQARGVYIMLRNINGYIVLQVSYRSPAGNSNIIDEQGLDAITPIKVEDLRYVRLKKAEEGFDIWLNDYKMNNNKLKAIPHDVTQDKNGKMYFGFCTWSAPDLSPQLERTALITAVINEGKTKLVATQEPKGGCGCGSETAAGMWIAIVLPLVAAVLLLQRSRKNNRSAF